MEVRVGFEPTHRGFADLSLNHLGTAPREKEEDGRRTGGVNGKVGRDFGPDVQGGRFGVSVSLAPGGGVLAV